MSISDVEAEEPAWFAVMTKRHRLKGKASEGLEVSVSLVLVLVLVMVLVLVWLLRKVYHICTSLIIIFGCRIVEHITSLAVVKNDAGDACQENKVSEEDVDDVVNTVAACAKEGM